MEMRAIRKMSDDELRAQVGSLRRTLFDLRTQAVTEKIQDTSQYGSIRRDIARLLTEGTARRGNGPVAGKAGSR